MHAGNPEIFFTHKTEDVIHQKLHLTLKKTAENIWSKNPTHADEFLSPTWGSVKKKVSCYLCCFGLRRKLLENELQCMRMDLKFELILFKQISIGSNLEYETPTLQIPGLFLLLFSLPFVSYSFDFFERIQNQMQVFKEVFSKPNLELCSLGLWCLSFTKNFPENMLILRSSKWSCIRVSFFLYLPTAAESVSPAGTVPFTAGHWKFWREGRRCREEYSFLGHLVPWSKRGGEASSIP